MLLKLPEEYRESVTNRNDILLLSSCDIHKKSVHWSTGKCHAWGSGGPLTPSFHIGLEGQLAD